MLRGIDGYGTNTNFNIGGNQSASAGSGPPAAENAIGGVDDEAKHPGRKSSPEDCETCKRRKYQDGSDESDVSFQNPTHIDPSAAGAAVRAHEQQHVMNAYQKASEKGGKVLSVGVSIHTAVCPECGRVYVSGGLTESRIAYPKDDPRGEDDKDMAAGGTSNPYAQQKQAIGQMLNVGIRTDTIT